jgi:hypothetical protein
MSIETVSRANIDLGPAKMIRKKKGIVALETAQKASLKRSERQKKDLTTF